MIRSLRPALQGLFFLLSVSVFFGAFSDRSNVYAYHAVHVMTSLSHIAWWTLPPLFGVTVFFLLLPLVFGRLYCGFLCPAGFVQDLSGRISGFLGCRLESRPGWGWLRLGVLFFALAALALRSSSYHYVDHFSNWGRVLASADALIAGRAFGVAFVWGLLFLGILLLLPLRYPRWFCNALCPSGTLFTWMQRRALFRVEVGESCTDCGKCTTLCPVRCLGAGRIDHKACVACLECIEACPSGSIALRYRGPGSGLTRKTSSGEGRRRFLTGGIAAAAGIAAGALWKKRVIASCEEEPSYVVPPGGRSGAMFVERCVGCGTCVALCPTGVLIPAGTDSGLIGLAKAKMDFDRGYCAFECNVCLSVCPSGAISYFPIETKKKVKIGGSRLDKGICIPYAEGKDCAACQEQCPTGAITMEREGDVFGPVINDDYCIGCGSCQFACPTSPRAIVVEPHSPHSFAFNPRQRHHSPTIGDIPRPDTVGFPF